MVIIGQLVIQTSTRQRPLPCKLNSKVLSNRSLSYVVKLRDNSGNTGYAALVNSQADVDKPNGAFLSGLAFGQLVINTAASGKGSFTFHNKTFFILEFTKYNNEKEFLKSKEVYDYLVDTRKVSRLVHFTPIDNLKSIFSFGLVPRSMQFFNAVALDKDRYDGLTDCNCLSVSFPNYRMFFSKREKHRILEFAVLSINPRIILDTIVSDVFYTPTNAAAGTVQDITGLTGLSSAQALFEDSPWLPSDNETGASEISIRQMCRLSDSDTTDPQAEVLIRGVIPSDYIDGVIVNSEQIRQHVIDILGNDYAEQISVKPGMFGYRDDFKYWR